MDPASALSSLPADLPLTQALNAWNTGAPGVLAHAMYFALEPVFAVLLAAAVAGLVALRRRDLALGFRFGLTVALAWLPVGVVKLFLHRPRPAAALLAHPTPVPPGDWSFPSGHVAFVTALALALTLLAAPGRARRVRAALGAVAVAGIAVVVLILGVHYPTDVLASIAWVLLTGPLMWRVAGRAARPVRRVLDARRSPEPAVRPASGPRQSGVPSR